MVKEKYNVMLDPSLIVAELTIDNTLTLVEKFSNEFNFYIPNTFKNNISKAEFLLREDAVFKFFKQNARPANIKYIKNLIKNYPIKIFKVTSDEKQKYQKFYLSLKECLITDARYWGDSVSEQVLEILFEEWIFLQEYSWIVSRTKKTFNKFINGGGICLQFGKKFFDILVRKTIKKDEILKVTDILRAFSKWIAVGGSTILKNKFHIEIPWEIDLIKNFFILFDP